jgi:hypothetical protein
MLVPAVLGYVAGVSTGNREDKFDLITQSACHTSHAVDAQEWPYPATHEWDPVALPKPVLGCSVLALCLLIFILSVDGQPCIHANAATGLDIRSLSMLRAT